MVLRNSQILLGCQPEDEGRFWCTNTRHWPENSVVISRLCFWARLSQILTKAPGSRPWVYRSQIGGRIEATFSPPIREEGVFIPSEVSCIYHWQGPLWCPHFDAEKEPATFFVLPGILSETEICLEGNTPFSILNTIRPLKGRFLEFCGKTCFPSVLCILLAPHFPKGSRSSRLSNMVCNYL